MLKVCRCATAPAAAAAAPAVSQLLSGPLCFYLSVWTAFLLPPAYSYVKFMTTPGSHNDTYAGG